VIYQDGKDAHWESNPKSYQITKQKVTAKTILTIPLAPGGGTAIQIR
jgi:glucan 1,4-alpha-glucosidase